MKLDIVFTGKTKTTYIDEGIRDYFKRLQYYIKTEIVVIPDLKNTKNMSEYEIKKKEGNAILSRIPQNSVLILLDEKGKDYSSEGLSKYISKKTMEGRDICMLIGGAYGFSKEIYNRSDSKISLSKMTFSHQMVRMILLEQIYRAFTILKGEKYHHGGSLLDRKK